jgi:hypothetical protein
MRRDRVSVAEVQSCVEHPDETRPTVNGRTNYFQRTERGLLRVTAIEEDGDMLIITVLLPKRRR